MTDLKYIYFLKPLAAHITLNSIKNNIKLYGVYIEYRIKMDTYYAECL